MLVQLAVVGLLVRMFGLHYLVATAIGVESAVLHNFIWHQHWTWRDRRSGSAKAMALRLMRFHVLNGAVSLVGNIAVTAFCTGIAGLDAVVSNVIAIVACSAVNFTASESLVFRADRRQRLVSLPIAIVGLLTLPPIAEAGPGSATLAAWRTYEAQIDGRYNASASG